MHSVGNGTVPPVPIAALIGFGIAEVEEGRIVICLTSGRVPLQPDRHDRSKLGPRSNQCFQ